MSFWKNVDKELEYTGKTRKELAAEVNFPDSYISKGISRNSIPSADLALKIAHALNVPLEILLDIKTSKSPSQKETEQNQLRLYRKYHNLIEKCENLDSDKIQLMEQLAENLEKKDCDK